MGTTVDEDALCSSHRPARSSRENNHHVAQRRASRQRLLAHAPLAWPTAWPRACPALPPSSPQTTRSSPWPASRLSRRPCTRLRVEASASTMTAVAACCRSGLAARSAPLHPAPHAPNGELFAESSRLQLWAEAKWEPPWGFYRLLRLCQALAALRVWRRRQDATSQPRKSGAGAAAAPL